MAIILRKKFQNSVVIFDLLQNNNHGDFNQEKRIVIMPRIMVTKYSNKMSKYPLTCTCVL